MNKSRFKEAMRTTGKVLGTTASALLWPVKMAGKGLYKAGSWFLEHPIRNTLIGGALLYFGAPYLFKAAGAAEGAFAGVGLDWLRRRTQTLSKLGTGTNPSAPPDTGRPTAPRPSVM